MKFPINAYLLTFAAAFVTSFASVPIWRAWSRRIGLVDDPGHRKIHHVPVPLAGGLAVFTGMVVPILAGLVALQLGFFETTTFDPLSYGFGKRTTQLAAILAGAIGMLVIGLLDDKFELKPVVKLCGQIAIATMVAAAGVRITLFVPSIAFSNFITVFWILTVINAFNFMDNMNGLCAGLGAIGALWFAIIAAGLGQYLVALLAFLTAGALVGFLPYNYPKASVFLGDAGSHLVGYLLAVLAILPHFYSEKNPAALAVMTPLLVLAVPLLDMAWVVLLRTR
ncbi:MAG: undecaprenyl/decaprenyl-phosphate alpha-N-acetylglucosaminyl 1-phosphate transferase, partial [Opitutaceae bacterium]|nr:undecaprenyl/decaprenyl-phosphate alpha-N-acetylglucosaminyl 1-phosphate transferase [Verrucomicrobiales bacterium]